MVSNVFFWRDSRTDYVLKIGTSSAQSLPTTTRGAMNEPIAAEGTSSPFAGNGLSPARILRFAAAFPLLVEAAQDADSIRADRWQFSLTLGELQSAELTGTDLRWLVSRGILQHRTGLIAW